MACRKLARAGNRLSEHSDQPERHLCVLRLRPGLSLEQVGRVHGVSHPERHPELRASKVALLRGEAGRALPGGSVSATGFEPLWAPNRGDAQGEPG